MEEFTIYYIYEVPGHKNGATMQWDKRSNQNFDKYGIRPVLIETMEGPNEPEFWQIVGDREWELADLNGYPRGTHYRVAREKRHVNHTEETKRKISNFQKGRVKSEAEKQNMSRARKGVPLTFTIWNKNKKVGPLSTEHRRKISESNKGKVHSEETKQRLRTTTPTLDMLIIQDIKAGLSQRACAKKHNTTRGIVVRIIRNMNE